MSSSVAWNCQRAKCKRNCGVKRWRFDIVSYYFCGVICIWPWLSDRTTTGVDFWKGSSLVCHAVCKERKQRADEFAKQLSECEALGSNHQLEDDRIRPELPVWDASYAIECCKTKLK